MKAYLGRIIIYNRAPFDNLDLSFDENGISVLTGVNGQGKTTIQSYIVDSWFEIIRNYYTKEFKGQEQTYYRVSTSMFVPDMTKPSVVYIRYRVDENNVDYLNIESELTETQYNELVNLQDRIPFKKIKGKENLSQKGKFVSESANKELVMDWFSHNIMTSFPSFRYELPYYITDFFKTQFKFRKQSYFSGYLRNPLIVASGLDGVANWLMDLVMDKELYDKNPTATSETNLWRNVSSVLTLSLSSKFKGMLLRLAIGRRNSGASRISVVRQEDSSEVYPSIFGMSSGEIAVLSMFVEILRQADNLSINIKLEDIQGIVLIDEIDKHLHLKLQKEVLPAMLELFPNVQFVISTHSPFFTMGLADNTIIRKRSKIVDLDQVGLETEPQSIGIYQEIYDIMVEENDNFRLLYNDLHAQLKLEAKPLVITEGKTDAKHIKNALTKLGNTDVDIEFYEIGNQKWGDSELKNMLEQLAKINNHRKIIGIFDRDVDDYVKFASDGVHAYKLLRPGSNVYAFSIPLVNEEEYGPKISIEHYYHKKDLLKENSDKRRIFLGGEFYQTGNSIDGKYQAKVKDDKIKKNGIVDEKVYLSTDLNHEHPVAMTKNDFADLVCGESDYAVDFDFSNFNQIIDMIREIIKK